MVGIEQLGRRLRIGMIGGGIGSYIGESHRIALRADGLWDLVAGVFSRNPETSAATGRSLLIDPQRVYADHRVLIESEAQRQDRVDAVIVATLPATHAQISIDLLNAGFHVVSEKPLTATADEASRVAAAVESSGKHLLLTHCYSGYPMVRMAREMVSRGDLGQITIIDTEFPSGAYAGGTPENAWRVLSDDAGSAGMLLDLATHALHLATYVSGQQVGAVNAKLDRIDPAHQVYDSGFLNLEFSDGAVGRCWSTFQAAGAVHGLGIAIYGTRGSLHWDHEHAEVMWWRPVDGPAALLTKAGPLATPAALDASRFTAGHPDGYGLAFANLYRDFAYALIAESVGADPTPHLGKIPNVVDGVHTLEIVEAAVRSHEADQQSVRVPGVGQPRSVSDGDSP